MVEAASNSREGGQDRESARSHRRLFGHTFARPVASRSQCKAHRADGSVHGHEAEPLWGSDPRASRRALARTPTRPPPWGLVLASIGCSTRSAIGRFCRTSRSGSERVCWSPMRPAVEGHNVGTGCAEGPVRYPHGRRSPTIGRWWGYDDEPGRPAFPPTAPPASSAMSPASSRYKPSATPPKRAIDSAAPPPNSARRSNALPSTGSTTSSPSTPHELTMSDDRSVDGEILTLARAVGIVSAQADVSLDEALNPIVDRAAVQRFAEQDIAAGAVDRSIRVCE